MLAVLLFISVFSPGAERIQVEMLRDILPGANSSSPEIHAAAAGRVFFSASTPETGAELWVSDGSFPGTYLVKDIRPGTPGSGILNMAVLGSRVFFTADDGTHGKEIWRSDGTGLGTYLLKDIAPGVASGAPGGAKTIFDALFFPGFDEGTGMQPWTSDGTTEGTMLLKRINEQALGLDLMAELDCVVVPELGLAFFQGITGVGVYRRGLWKSDGTAAGTQEVFSLMSGITSYNPMRLTACNGLLFFVISSWVDGPELWATDGTPAGTYMVKDIMPGGVGSNPRNLVCCDNVLYFYAEDSVYGIEPWRSDGTTAGTWMLADIAPNGASSMGHVIACMEEFLILAAHHPDYGRELWRITPDGSLLALIKDVNPLGNSYQPANDTGQAVLNGILYVQLDDGVHGRELWRTDGTEAGTWMVEDINPGSAGSSPLNMTVVDNNLFFSADDGTHGNELWILRYLPFRFALQPIGKRLEAGNPVTLRVEVENATGEVTYKWFFNDTLIPSAVGPELHFPYAEKEGSGWYHCQATDSTDATITSTKAYVEILPENSLPLSMCVALAFGIFLFLIFLCSGERQGIQRFFVNRQGKK